MLGILDNTIGKMEVKKNIITTIDLKVITKDFKLCKTFFTKMHGLMFSKPKDLLFVFNREKRLSFHMLFVPYNIWIVYINKDFIVTKFEKLYSFISLSFGKAKYVLELIEYKDIKVGDKLIIKLGDELEKI